MNSIEKICALVNKVTKEEVKEMEEKVMVQKLFIHPLKHATQGKVNKAGNYNERVLEKFKALYLEIKRGPLLLSMLEVHLCTS